VSFCEGEGERDGRWIALFYLLITTTCKTPLRAGRDGKRGKKKGEEVFSRRERSVAVFSGLAVARSYMGGGEGGGEERGEVFRRKGMLCFFRSRSPPRWGPSEGKEKEKKRYSARGGWRAACPTSILGGGRGSASGAKRRKNAAAPLLPCLRLAIGGKQKGVKRGEKEGEECLPKKRKKRGS